MEHVSTPHVRLSRVLAVIGRAGVDVVSLPSDSNDVWRVDDVVLRICYRGDLARFVRDGLVAASAPSAVKAPRLLDQGQVGDMVWQLSSLVRGVPLGVAWPTLSLADRRRAIGQVGAALAALHGHVFPASVRAALATPRPVGDGSAAAVIGADLNPLPVSRARLLLGPAERLPGVDPAVIRAVADRFDELEPVDPLDDGQLARHGGGVVVHGDAHPGNVLWSDGVVAVLDWEWVRLGGHELDIEPFLSRGYEAHPSLQADASRIVSWLADAYPEAFAAPDLLDRLWLIELAHTLRDLLLQPPDRPYQRLVAGHPLRRLHQLAASPAAIAKLLPGGQASR